MNTHIINKQIIDLKIPSEEHAFDLRQEARDAYMENVLPFIGEILDEFAGPDEVLRIDRLELDFGMLRQGNMGVQMKERVREAILKQMPALKQKIVGGKESFSILESFVDGKRTKAELMHESFSQRELLKVFFETGLLPWWSPDEIDAPDIDAIIISLLEKEPVSTVQWMHQLAVKSPAAIQRMMMQLEQATQKQVLAAFPVKAIATIKAIVKQLQQLQRSVDYFPLFTKTAEPTLFAVLVMPSEALQLQQEITAPKVVEMLVARLAVLHNVSESTVQKQLYADTLAVIIAKDHKKESVADVVDYFIEWEKKHPEIAVSVSGNAVPVLETIVEEKEQSISELADAIEQALIAYEEKRSFFQKSRKKPAKQVVRQHRKQQLPKDEIQDESEISSNIPAAENTIEPAAGKHQIISQEAAVEQSSDDTKPAVAPGAADEQIIPQTEEINTVKINWFKATDENDIPVKIDGKIEAVRSEVPAAENKAVKSEEKKEEAVAEPQIEKPAVETTTEDIAAEEKSISEQVEEFMKAEGNLDEEHPLLKKKRPSAGMTRFGGLVLIAPFLPAFFNEMKLIEDGKFINEAAQHKAIHFLNFMATGKTSSPEYKLLLHKLLCGIELTQPVPKTVKLGAAEKKEAMLFLDDVAGQWTALRSTSGEAFRETFFRRNGILEQRDNLWLLRVERGPMDIMLDTLPWPISIIKAPWMQQLLQVEW